MRKSNDGGWHSSGNLFGGDSELLLAIADGGERDAVIGDLAGLRNLLFGCATDHLVRGHGHDGSSVSVAATAWAIVNRPGDTNRLHTHDGWMLSGVAYLRVPGDMTGGRLMFSPPTDALGAPTFVQPQTGLVVVFPAWVPHAVEPFESAEPSAARVVVSFNVRW